MFALTEPRYSGLKFPIQVVVFWQLFASNMQINFVSKSPGLQMLETQDFSKAQVCPGAVVLNPTCTVVDDSGNSVHEVEFKNMMSTASY